MSVVPEKQCEGQRFKLTVELFITGNSVIISGPTANISVEEE